MNNYDEGILLRKNVPFIVKDTKVIVYDDVFIRPKEKGYFILNFWEQCSIADIETFPVSFVSCDNEQEAHELFKTNIIYGVVSSDI